MAGAGGYRAGAKNREAIRKFLLRPVGGELLNHPAVVCNKCVRARIASAPPGSVEEWRHAPQVRSIRCSPFPLRVPH
jgi:hypothetical protein